MFVNSANRISTTVSLFAYMYCKQLSQPITISLFLNKDISFEKGYEK